MPPYLFFVDRYYDLQLLGGALTLLVPTASFVCDLLTEYKSHSDLRSTHRAEHRPGNKTTPPFTEAKDGVESQETEHPSDPPPTKHTAESQSKTDVSAKPIYETAVESC